MPISSSRFAARLLLVPLALALAAPDADRLGAAPPLARNDGASCEVPAAITGGKARPGGAAPTAATTPTPEAATGRQAQSPALAAISGTPLVVAPRRAASGTPSAGAAIAIATAAATTAPVSTPAGDRTPAADPEAALARELTEVAQALGACLSDGDAAGVVELATEAYLGQLYGGGDPLGYDDYLVIAPQLDTVPTDVRGLEEVRPSGDDRATAVVTQVVGNQLLRSRWTFVREPRRNDPDASPWRVDREEALPVAPPSGSRAIDVTLSDYAFALDPVAVAGADLLLRGENVAAQDHEMLVLRVEGGRTVQDLLRAVGPALPDGFAYVGQATVPAGGSAELALVDLEPGDYLLVCLFPDERGLPHAALGMAAAFNVTGEESGG